MEVTQQILDQLKAQAAQINNLASTVQSLNDNIITLKKSLPVPKILTSKEAMKRLRIKSLPSLIKLIESGHIRVPANFTRAKGKPILIVEESLAEYEKLN